MIRAMSSSAVAPTSGLGGADWGVVVTALNNKTEIAAKKWRMFSSKLVLQRRYNSVTGNISRPGRSEGVCGRGQKFEAPGQEAGGGLVRDYDEAACWPIMPPRLRASACSRIGV